LLPPETSELHSLLENGLEECIR
jgi:chromosome segregation ATPase